MSPDDLVTVAPDPDDIGAEEWAELEPIYCCTVRLIALDAQAAVVESPRNGRRYDLPAAYLRPLRTQLFPYKGDGTRAVVYLDQCVVSELVKHGRGELHGRNAHAAETLMRALDEAIFRRETAVCIESLNHQVESSGLLSGGRPGGHERFAAIGQFLALRSRRLSSQTRDDAVAAQACQLAGLRTGGHVLRPEHLWKLGLTRDPQLSNADTGSA
jgi:hypothetical protein